MSILPSTKPAEVESINQWCPEKLQAKRPENKAEECLVFVADILTLQDQRDAAGQSQRNPLQHVEEEKKQHVPQLTADPRPDSVTHTVLRVRPSNKPLGLLFYFCFRETCLSSVHVSQVLISDGGTCHFPLPPVLVCDQI